MQRGSLMKANAHFDVVVIGGGPAGVTAALRTSELGARTALVERGRMGGTCTNDGCVPTRALAKAARLMRDAGQFSIYGLVGEKPMVDFAALLARTQQIVYQVHEKKQLIRHLEASGAAVFTETGRAFFTSPQAVSTEHGQTLKADKFILCAGGHARRLDFPGSEYALTHSDVWSLKALPKRVAIVGAAATGCQLASIFNDFGSEVWLMDIASAILPGEDHHVSAAVGEAFQRQGVRIWTGIEGIQKIEKRAGGYELFISAANQTEVFEVEAVILAVGWPGNGDKLGLESAGVATEHGFIQVDDTLQTTNPAVFAAGDITGRMMLVQSAGYEARIAAENAILDRGRRYDHLIVPHGGFTDPEYGSVGLTEQQAEAQLEISTAVVPYSDLDRAVIDGHTAGFCKLIVSQQDHRVVGAHVVGEQAVEIVQLIATGMAADLTVQQLAGLELAYPTYTAIAGLAARRITAELGLTALAPAWRALGLHHTAEWERSE
jgi:dihydrolipoamide dehydrogenase